MSNASDLKMLLTLTHGHVCNEFLIISVEPVPNSCHGENNMRSTRHTTRAMFKLSLLDTGTALAKHCKDDNLVLDYFVMHRAGVECS